MGEISSLEEETKDAVPGKCDPKPVCISNPLILNISSTQLAFPQCINIHRCEGCCPTNEKCVAVGSHEVKLQKVGIINFEDGNEPQFSETFISVLNHTDCQCQCQWQTDQDCKAVNPNYVKNENAYVSDKFEFFNENKLIIITKKDANVCARLKCTVDL